MGRASRCICISDLHGCYSMMINLLEKIVKLNLEKDLLAVCGDVIDRGPETMECILYLTALRNKFPDRVKLLMGNHEFTALQSLTRGNGNREDMRIPLTWITSLGGEQTVKSFGGVENAKEILIPYCQSLDYFLETRDFIFCHGGIKRGVTDIKSEMTVNELLNLRTMEYEGPKTVICGHTVQDKVRFHGKHVVAIDTGGVFVGKLSAYDCLNKVVYWVESTVSSPYFVGQR